MHNHKEEDNAYHMTHTHTLLHLYLHLAAQVDDETADSVQRVLRVR